MLAAGLTGATTAIATLRLRSPRTGRPSGRLRDLGRLVPRRWFDHRLVQHMEAAGATLRRRRVRRLSITSDSVLVDRATITDATPSTAIAVAQESPDQ